MEANLPKIFSCECITKLWCCIESRGSPSAIQPRHSAYFFLSLSMKRAGFVKMVLYNNSNNNNYKILKKEYFNASKSFLSLLSYLLSRQKKGVTFISLYILIRLFSPKEVQVSEYCI